MVGSERLGYCSFTGLANPEPSRTSHPAIREHDRSARADGPGLSHKNWLLVRVQPSTAEVAQLAVHFSKHPEPPLARASSTPPSATLRRSGVRSSSHAPMGNGGGAILTPLVREGTRSRCLLVALRLLGPPVVSILADLKAYHLSTIMATATIMVMAMMPAMPIHSITTLLRRCVRTAPRHPGHSPSGSGRIRAARKPPRAWRHRSPCTRDPRTSC